jgi:glycosyltransferase involved in cell wall biosynthesis
MKLVSVIVPTYNQAKYLPICLDSVWFQNHPNLEIVVVNDGSVDQTSSVIEKYICGINEDKASFASNYNLDEKGLDRTWHMRYPTSGRRLRVLEHPSNRGLGHALNTGVNACNGDYCTFIASDDMLLPSAMTELAALLDQGFDFAYADMHIVDDAGRILRRFSLPDYTFENAFCHWYLCGVCKLYRRDLHEQVGFYDEKVKPQDHEMYLRFAMHGARFVHIPKVLANVRIHDDQRLVDNHMPENWTQLYRESAALVRKARRYLREGR